MRRVCVYHLAILVRRQTVKEARIEMLRKIRKRYWFRRGAGQLIFGVVASLAMTIAIAERTRFEQNGIRVQFSLDPLSEQRAKPQANSDAVFRFDIGDASGSPVSGAYPAVWMQRRAESVPTDQKACQNLVKSFTT